MGCVTTLTMTPVLLSSYDSSFLGRVSPGHRAPAAF